MVKVILYKYTHMVNYFNHVDEPKGIHIYRGDDEPLDEISDKLYHNLLFNVAFGCYVYSIESKLDKLVIKTLYGKVKFKILNGAIHWTYI